MKIPSLRELFKKDDKRSETDSAETNSETRLDEPPTG